MGKLNIILHLFKEADHNSRLEMTSFTIWALNFVVVSSLLEASWSTPLPGPTPCTSCENGNAIAFGDDDPHITVRLGRSQLDRPICYDLDGSSGDAFRLFRVGNLMTVDGHLMQSPRYKHHNSSYFGKMIFNTKDVKITVTHDLVTVTSGAAKPKFHKWRKSVPKHHSTLFADPSVDLSVVHFRRKVMKISFQGTDFEIKKNQEESPQIRQKQKRLLLPRYLLESQRGNDLRRNHRRDAREERRLS